MGEKVSKEDVKKALRFYGAFLEPLPEVKEAIREALKRVDEGDYFEAKNGEVFVRNVNVANDVHLLKLPVFRYSATLEYLIVDVGILKVPSYAKELAALLKVFRALYALPLARSEKTGAWSLAEFRSARNAALPLVKRYGFDDVLIDYPSFTNAIALVSVGGGVPQVELFRPKLLSSEEAVKLLVAAAGLAALHARFVYEQLL